jgi:hypothetical protein
MKTRKTQLLFAITLALILPLLVLADVRVIVDDQFADGNSQNQDLANNSLRVFKARSGTVRTDAMGSVTFDVTRAAGAEAFWAFFTDADKPVKLGVGDKLTVAVTFSVQGFRGTGQDIRFGVLNSFGSRNTADLNSGMNQDTFVGDLGYNVRFIPQGGGTSVFIVGRRTTIDSGNVFNTSDDFTVIPGMGPAQKQPLIDNTPYTLSYTIERVTDVETRISVAVTGGMLTDLNWTAVETTTPETLPFTTFEFDYFGFRLGSPTTQSNFANVFTFTRLLVEHTPPPPPPVITSQPAPSEMTVTAGSTVTMSVGASGEQLSYRWRKDGQAMSGNSSATTPTLILNNAQLNDSGVYTAVVSNPGGSVTSNAVNLTVNADYIRPPRRSPGEI